MEKYSVLIAFDYDQVNYRGWATPAETHHAYALAKSYHVVLNGTFFGEMSYADGHWTVSEQRPKPLVAATGSAILRAVKPNTRRGRTNPAQISAKARELMQ